MLYFDAHIHLDKYTDKEGKQFANDPDLVGLIAVSMDLESSKRTLQLKQSISPKVFAGAGFHPEQQAVEVDSLCQWIHHHQDELDFIGEIGLPYYHKYNDPTQDIAIFRKMVACAAEYNKPVVVHAVREDVYQAYQILQEYAIKQAHFHWIKTDSDTLTLLAQAGYYVSFTPDIWYQPETAHIAVTYPLPLIMVETDGPWPFEGRFANQPTTPQLLPDVIKRLADLRRMEVDQLASRLVQNTQRFLCLSPHSS